MTFSLMLAAALLLIMATLHLISPFIYGLDAETIGIIFFGLTYLILGVLIIYGLQYLPLTALVVTALGTFGAVRSYEQNVELQRMNRIFIRLGTLIVIVLLVHFIVQFL